jgi:hypothetical protein
LFWPNLQELREEYSIKQNLHENNLPIIIIIYCLKPPDGAIQALSIKHHETQTYAQIKKATKSILKVNGILTFCYLWHR